MAPRALAGAVLLAAALALPPTVTLGASYKPKGRAVDYRGHFAPFPSGLRLVVYEMPHLDRFALSVSYGAGSVDDPAGKEGLAHLAEHVAFRATPAGGGQRIWERLVASGMRFNAFTEMEHTDYWITGTSAELGEALRIEAARMADPAAGVGDDDFAIERDVVVSEWRERYETELEAAKWQWVRELAFPGHPYARPIAGTPSSLGRISLSDVRAWMKAHYDPARAVIVLVSPFSPEDALRRVMDAFGPHLGDAAAPRPPVARTPPPMPEPPARPAAIPTRAAPVQKAELWVAWPVPGTYAGLEPKLLALSGLLEAQVGYRLSKLAQWDVVDGVDVGLDLMDGAGLLLVKVVLHDASKADKVLDTVRFAAGELRLGYGNDMDSMRDWLLVRSYLAMEEIWTPEIAQYLRATGKPDFLGDWQKRVAVQLQDDVDGFAAKWLGADRSAAVLIVPDRNLRAADLAGGAARGPSYVDPLEEEAATIPPPGPERVVAVLRPPGLAAAERRTLENGLEVAFLKQGTLPVAEVRVAVRTPAEGSAAAPLGAPLLALWSSQAASVGYKERGAGLSRSRRRDADSLVIAGRGSSGNLSDLLETQAQWAKEVSFSGPAFDRIKKVARRLQAVVSTDPVERARSALHERLFPGHPYGASVTPEAIDALSSRQASAWLSSNVRPERASVIVVSDVAPSAEGWKWIQKRFGGWDREGAGPVPPAPIAPIPAARSVVVVERRGATQATIAVGFRVPPLAERDAPALEAVRWLLESRLNQRIRVEEGVSYGVSAGLVERRQAAALIVSATVDADAAARTIETILRAAAELAAAPLQPASAGRARWMVARAFASRFDTVHRAADALETIALHGLPPDHFDRMPARIASLDAGRIQAAARTLSLGREVVVAAGDAALVPGLAGAGLAPEVLPEPAAAAR
jgi:zinc protease